MVFSAVNLFVIVHVHCLLLDLIYHSCAYAAFIIKHSCSVYITRYFLVLCNVFFRL